MVPVLAKIRIKDGKMDEAIDMIKALLTEVTKEEGTLIYKFCRDENKPNIVIVMEAYKDKAALSVHSSTPHFKEFFGKIGPILDGEPEIMVMEEIASI